MPKLTPKIRLVIAIFCTLVGIGLLASNTIWKGPSIAVVTIGSISIILNILQLKRAKK